MSTNLSQDNTPDSASPKKPEFVRLPRVRERCPYTGLSRSSMAELVVDGPANGGKAPVKSVVLRKRGAIRGVRLVVYDSLIHHLKSLRS